MTNLPVAPARVAPRGRLLPLLLGGLAIGFGVASTIHFGLPLGPFTDPFAGARVPEAVLAVLLGAAAVYTLVGLPGARWAALTALAISLLGVGFGLTVTVPAALWGDVAYHLVAAAAILGTAVVALRR